MKMINIKNFPEISYKQKMEVLTGIRPFRKGGIRIQKQKIGNKLIVHNYGHGGAGVSLAPSSATQAASLVKSQLKSETQQISILGCGIIALLTAVQCIKQGCKVSIYAQKIPTLQLNKVHKNASNINQRASLITSQVAPGYWLPYNYDFCNKKQHQQRSEISYKYYQQCLKVSKYLRKVQVYQEMTSKQVAQRLPSFLAKNCQTLNVKIGQKQFGMINFQTIQIDLPKFLDQLIATCLKNKVKFYQRSFKSLEQIVQLPQNIIVNCLGLSCKYIFKDQSVYGVKGHLIKYKNTTKIGSIFGFKYNDSTSHKLDGPIKIYCFDDKILVGATSQLNEGREVNHQLVSQLQQRSCKFYELLGLKTSNDINPKL